MFSLKKIEISFKVVPTRFDALHIHTYMRVLDVRRRGVFLVFLG